MVSTLKLVLTALALQLVIGAALTMATQPSNLPYDVTNQIEGDAAQFRNETLDRSSRGYEVKLVGDVIDMGDEGLRAGSLIGFMTKSLWNGFYIPYATDALDENLLTQLIKWGLILYQLILGGYFVFEIYMVVMNKKTNG